MSYTSDTLKILKNPIDTNSSYYNVSIRNNIIHLIITDSVIYKIIPSSRNNFMTSISDEKTVKNLDIVSNNEIFYNNKFVYLLGNSFLSCNKAKEEFVILRFDGLKGLFQELNKNDSIIYQAINQNSLFGYFESDNFIDQIYMYSLDNNTIEKLNIDNLEGVFEIYYLKKTNSLLIGSAIHDADIVLDLEYSNYSINKKELRTVTAKFKDALKSYYKTDDDFFNIGIISNYFNFQNDRIYINAHEYLTPVLSDNFSFLYETITLDADILGPVLQNDTLSALLYHARTENHESYVIPFDFSPSFEKCMGLVYKDQVIDKDLLTGFDKVKLSILKNLVFARHNYGFKNPYYQAFFNLFAFYHNPAAARSRLSDVSDLLTESDNLNLALINETLKKIK